MHIKTFCKLNNETLDEVKKIELVCKKYDALKSELFLDNSINFNQNIHTVFLLYINNKVVSILTLFIPTPQEAGISACTLPEFRNKGYFTALLLKASEELFMYQIPEILFVCESHSYAGIEAIKKTGAIFSFSEYYLRYTSKINFHNNDIDPKLEFCPVKQDQLDSLIDITQQIFKDNYYNTKNDILSAFQSDNILQYLVFLDNQLIGTYSLRFEADEVSIFDFGVLPDFQGKGLGKSILHLLIEDLHKQNIENIAIQVESQNSKAFNLYTNNGFEIDTTYNYYRKRV